MRTRHDVIIKKGDVVMEKIPNEEILMITSNTARLNSNHGNSGAGQTDLNSENRPVSQVV